MIGIHPVAYYTAGLYPVRRYSKRATDTSLLV
jgi:hypothetical protein